MGIAQRRGRTDLGFFGRRRGHRRRGPVIHVSLVICAVVLGSRRLKAEGVEGDVGQVCSHQIEGQVEAMGDDCGINTKTQLLLRHLIVQPDLEISV